MSDLFDFIFGSSSEPEPSSEDIYVDDPDYVYDDSGVPMNGQHDD